MRDLNTDIVFFEFICFQTKIFPLIIYLIIKSIYYSCIGFNNNVIFPHLQTAEYLFPINIPKTLV